MMMLYGVIDAEYGGVLSVFSAQNNSQAIRSLEASCEGLKHSIKLAFLGILNDADLQLIPADETEVIWQYFPPEASVEEDPAE